MNIESFYFDVKEHLNLKSCHKHHMSPYINMINGKVKLICCCVDFKLTCYNEINMVLTHHQADNVH